MGRPDDIPQDIWLASKEVGVGWPKSDVAVENIARAILAERESNAGLHDEFVAQHQAHAQEALIDGDLKAQNWHQLRAREHAEYAAAIRSHNATEQESV